MRPFPALLLLAATAGCAAPMPGPDLPAASSVAAPALLPLTGLLAAGDALAAAPPGAGDVAARAAALDARTAALAAPLPGGEAARIAALAARAEALRAPVLDDAERDRLAPAPSLP